MMEEAPLLTLPKPFESPRRECREREVEERGARDTEIPEGMGVAEGAGSAEVELALFSPPALLLVTLEKKDW